MRRRPRGCVMTSRNAITVLPIKFNLARLTNAFDTGSTSLSGVCTDTQQCHLCVFSALGTHFRYVAHMTCCHTPRNDRSRSECTCATAVCCLYPALFFLHSFGHSFSVFLNLNSTCRKDCQIIGFSCLVARFHSYSFSSLATE